MTLSIGAVPTAVDALRDRFKAALTAAAAVDIDMVGVELFDGFDTTADYTGKAVTVAAAFEDEQNAVNVTRAETGATARVSMDADVACSVYAGSGADDRDAIDRHRDMAGKILGVLEAALAADRRLGGAVALARITSTQWLQGRDEQGTGAAIGFIVQLRFLP